MGVIIRQSIKGTLATYFGVAVGFITTFFVLTSYLTPEQVGLTRVLVDAAMLFSSLALLGTSSSTLRFFPHFKDDSRNQQGLYFWTLIIPFVGFLLFLLFFFILKSVIIQMFEDKSELFVNYVFYTLPIAFFMLYMGVFETNASLLQRVAVPRLIREVFIRVALLVAYLLFGYHVITLDGLVISICVTYGLGALLNLGYLLFSQKISFKPQFGNISKEMRRDFLLYTAFLVMSALVANVLPTLSSFFISAKMGLLFTGIYAIANYIATVIEVPSRSLNALVQPRLAVALRATPPDLDTATRLLQKVSLHQFLASSALFLLIWVNIDLFFTLLPNGQAYEAGKWVVLILAFNKIINSSFSISGSALGYTRWYPISLLFTIFLMISSVVLNNYLIPIYGINGGALATTISYAVYYALLLLFVKWRVGIYPFSWSLLKVIVIIAGMALLDQSVRALEVGLLPDMGLKLRIVEAVVRTGLVGLFGIFFVLWWNVSPEINQMYATLKMKLGIKK